MGVVKVLAMGCVYIIGDKYTLSGFERFSEVKS
jgi:hypothetical protein